MLKLDVVNGGVRQLGAHCRRRRRPVEQGQLRAHHQAWPYLSRHCELFNPYAEGLNTFNSFTFVLSQTFSFKNSAKGHSQAGRTGALHSQEVPGCEQVPSVPWELWAGCAGQCWHRWGWCWCRWDQLLDSADTDCVCPSKVSL